MCKKKKKVRLVWFALLYDAGEHKTSAALSFTRQLPSSAPAERVMR